MKRTATVLILFLLLALLTVSAAADGVFDRINAYAANNSDWHIAPDNREGIRVSFDLNGGKQNGWLLIRLSVHDPVMPLNIESDVKGGVQQMAKALYEVLKDADNIELKNLKDFINI